MKTTRTRNTNYSEIVKMNKNEFNSILNSRQTKDGYGVSNMVRSMNTLDSFFILCEEKRAMSHLYQAAAAVNKKIAVRRGEKDEELGYWVLCIKG
jgi:hypothetical protein